MPGPMSAPNGNVFLTLKAREGTSVSTGKTAKKRGVDFSKSREGHVKFWGENQPKSKPRRPKMTRARRQEQEAI